MLTVAEKVHEGAFALWIYGTERRKTQVYQFLEDHQERIQKRLEVVIRQIDSAPMTYSHEYNFKLLEDKVWELKFVSLSIRLACIWDPRPKNLIVFYGFEKKSQKWPKVHLENMRTQMAKYLKEPMRIGLVEGK
jgi:hypothetical protein